MHHVLDSLTLYHDLRLVTLAVVVCAFGAASTMNVSSRVSRSSRARLWMVLLSLCAGATVWATHFIAMLAYYSSISTTYDIGLTVLSLVMGIVVMGMGFAVAIRFEGSARHGALGGVIVGLGVVLLHYVGMAAVRMPLELSYDATLVAASVLLSVILGALALSVAFGPEKPWKRQAGALLMVVMTASLHFTAMGAVHLEQVGDAPHGEGGVSRTVLAIAVAVASLAVLVIGMIGAIIDQRVSARLAAEAERFRALSDGALEGVVVHRNGQVLDANAAAKRMLGLRQDDLGRIDSWFTQCPTGRWATHRSGSESEAVEVILRRNDGSTFPAEVAGRLMRLADGDEGELLALRDLTVRKESEARITHLALHDPVTDLPNRRLFLELGRKAISTAMRSREHLAVLVLDIDDFKAVNDMHGHEGGDAVLRAMADRIAGTLRDVDVAARFGGDEFTILQTAVTEHAQTMSLIERLLSDLQTPVSWEGKEIVVGVSVGVAFYPDNGNAMELLLRNADTAMYRAKSGGKGTSRFFEPDMDEALVARRMLEVRLRRAIATEQLTVAYQPLVAATTRNTVAFEALLRWTDSELGIVPPSDFIPVAETTGMIIPLGEFVLRQACTDAMEWPDHVRVAVNLSAIQFRRKGLVECVRRALDKSGLPGERLELEITESLLIESRDDVLSQLNELNSLGVHIAMDDFGTGYSSLSYLQAFPFEKLKIDRVFVSKLPSDPQGLAIVQAIVGMGRSLGMRVVAEGVETDVQARVLTELECDDMQGFLVARPMAIEEVREFLREGPNPASFLPDRNGGLFAFANEVEEAL